MVLGLVVGGFQFADGVKVLTTGRFFGPPTPGPWRHVVEFVGIDPFSMGAVFVGFGAAWLSSTSWLLVSRSDLAWWSVVVVAVANLWYLPVGTFLSVVTLAVLVAGRSHLVG